MKGEAAFYCGLTLVYDCGCHFKVNIHYDGQKCGSAQIDDDGDACTLCAKHTDELQKEIEK